MFNPRILDPWALILVGPSSLLHDIPKLTFPKARPQEGHLFHETCLLRLEPWSLSMDGHLEKSPLLSSHPTHLTLFTISELKFLETPAKAVCIAHGSNIST